MFQYLGPEVYFFQHLQQDDILDILIWSDYSVFIPKYSFVHQ